MQPYSLTVHVLYSSIGHFQDALTYCAKYYYGSHRSLFILLLKNFNQNKL